MTSATVLTFPVIHGMRQSIQAHPALPPNKADTAREYILGQIEQSLEIFHATKNDVDYPQAASDLLEMVEEWIGDYVGQPSA